MLEHHSGALGAMQDAAAIHFKPDSDMDGMAGPAQQDAITLGRKLNLGPTPTLGVVAESPAHDQHVLGIADLGQQAAEVAGLHHADEFPAIE